MKKRKLLALLLALCMLFTVSVTGCNSGKSSSKKHHKTSSSDKKKKDKDKSDDDDDDDDDKDEDTDSTTKPKETTEATTEPTESDLILTDLSTFTPSETSQMTYETYVDPNGLFTMEIPSGWVVQSSTAEYVNHKILVYDPNDNTRQFAVMACLTGCESADASNLIYSSMGVYVPYFPSITTQGFFEMLSQDGCVINLYNFDVLENLGTTPLGGDLLHATCTDGYGNELEGMFTTLVFESGNNGNVTGGVDLSLVFAEGTQIMMATPEDFPNYAPIMTYCLSTLEYTDTYWSYRDQELVALGNQTTYLSQVSANISSMVMSSWEARSNTYDIMSQEYSDSILGYDRVVDNYTGEIYQVEYGIMDGYSGSQYSIIESGSELYNLPVSGTVYN